MKNGLIMSLLILLLPSFLMAQSAPLVFTHVTVIDVTGGPAKPNMTVVVLGRRIISIHKTTKARLPRDAQIIDATGKFLIPGLWDMHVHALSRDLPDLFLPLFVANGVTGVRDMGGDIPLQQVSLIKREITSGARLGPRIMAAGPILEGARPFWPFYISVRDASEGKRRDASEGKRAVDELVKNGADFIKVYNTLSRDSYLAIAEEARQKHVPFVGHVPDGMTSLEASRAGQSSPALLHLRRRLFP